MLDEKIQPILQKYDIIFIGEFIRETREELNRTTFPSSEDVRNTTIIVIISVIFFALYLFLVDHAWTYVLQAITWLVNKLAGF